jgi:hypothetical protein
VKKYRNPPVAEEESVSPIIPFVRIFQCKICIFNPDTVTVGQNKKIYSIAII